MTNITIPDCTAENPAAIGSALVMDDAAKAAKAIAGVIALAAAKQKNKHVGCERRDAKAGDYRSHQQSDIDVSRRSRHSHTEQDCDEHGGKGAAVCSMTEPPAPRLRAFSHPSTSSEIYIGRPVNCRQTPIIDTARNIRHSVETGIPESDSAPITLRGCFRKPGSANSSANSGMTAHRPALPASPAECRIT